MYTVLVSVGLCVRGKIFVRSYAFHSGANGELSRKVNEMKEGIHPKYEVCNVNCACGNAFETQSTKKEIRVEVCNKCHPFYTGKQKLVDTGGRVDRFKKRFNLDQAGK